MNSLDVLHSKSRGMGLYLCITQIIFKRGHWGSLCLQKLMICLCMTCKNVLHTYTFLKE